MANAEETPRGPATWETSRHERHPGRSCGPVPGKVRRRDGFMCYGLWHSDDFAENTFHEHRTTFGLGYKLLTYLFNGAERFFRK